MCGATRPTNAITPVKLTIAAEHYVAAFFKARPGGFMKFMRWFGAWVVLFGSKFVILEALDFAFGESVKFEGVLHGIVWLIIVVVTMVIIEELVVQRPQAPTGLRRDQAEHEAITSRGPWDSQTVRLYYTP